MRVSDVDVATVNDLIASNAALLNETHLNTVKKENLTHLNIT